jgi:hypothetical protein
VRSFSFGRAARPATGTNVAQPLRLLQGPFRSPVGPCKGDWIAAQRRRLPNGSGPAPHVTISAVRTLDTLLRFVAGLPRLPLGTFPTPLIRLDRLSDRLGVGRRTKGDDCSGVALGGNKTHKREFILDTVYMAKAFHGPLGRVGAHRIPQGARLLFLHTRGPSMTPAAEKRYW